MLFQITYISKAFDPFMNTKLLYQLSIILIAASLPWDMTISSFLTGVCAFLWLISPGKNFAALKKAWPIVVFFAIMLVSLSYSDNLSYGFKLIERKLSLLLFPLFFISMPPDSKNIQYSLKAFVLSCLAACLVSHTGTVIKLFENNDTWFDIFNKNYSYQSLTAYTGLHSSYFALYLVFASGILIVQLEQKRSLYKHILDVLCIVYFVFFTIHLSARLPIMVMYLLVTMSALVYQYKKGRIWKGIGIFFIANMLVAALLYNVRVTRYRFQQIFGITYGNGTKANDGAHKLNLWGAAIGSNKNFFFGEGIGDSKEKIIEELKIRSLENEHQKQLNSHNQYIETYVSTGMLGLLTYLFICLALLAYFYKQRNPYGVILILAFMMCTLTESMLERNKGIAFISFFATLLYSRKQEALPGEQAS